MKNLEKITIQKNLKIKYIKFGKMKVTLKALLIKIKNHLQS